MALETTFESSKFCRVCLVPEESTKFSSVFANNAKMAMKIFKLAGITIMDIDSKVPSIICQKCVGDIEAAEKLRMRILDADEYYSMMTLNTEKKFLETDVKTMIEGKHSIKKNSTKKKLQPETSKIKINNELKDKSFETSENLNPRKRKLEQEYDSVESPLPAQNALSFISKATPDKLGIQRMNISKSKKTIMKTAASMAVVNLTPKSSKNSKKEDSSKKKKKFTPKLNLKGPKPSKSSTSEDAKPMAFDCDSCNDSFNSPKLLNDHLVLHDADEEP